MNGKNKHLVAKRKIEKRKAYQRRKICVILAILSVILILGIVGYILFHTSNSIMEGTWIYNSGTKYEFDGKGNGCMCLENTHYPFTYTAKGDTLKINFVDESVSDCVYTFHIDANHLTLIGGKGTTGGTYLLTK